MYNEHDKERLKKLLRIESVQTEAKEGMPFGKGVYDCLTCALDMMQESGLSVKNVDGYCGYGEVGEGELFGVLCHLDVVPVGKGWHYPPFGAVEENGKIYARGALDDKSPFVAVLVALEQLLKEKQPKKRIRLIVGCNEESGWACMERYKKTEEMPAAGFSPDADFPVINCEKGILFHKITYPKPKEIRSLDAGQRPNVVPDEATCVFEDGTVLTEKGIASHASHPEKGKNALIALLCGIADRFSFAKELAESFSSYDGKGAAIDFSDRESGALTCNLGTAKEENGNLVFMLDVRYPITVKPEEITRKLREKLSACVEATSDQKPLFVAEDHPLVNALLAAYEEETGIKAKPITIGGGTYARVLPLGVAFGPCFPESDADIHCPDEYVDLCEWDKAIAIYKRALEKLCF